MPRPQLTQQERAFEQEAQLEEDRLLRDYGHPQDHIHLFRAAALSYDTILQFPVPWYDAAGRVPDDYWHFLQEWGAPSEAMPSHVSQRGPTFTAREQL